MSLSQPVPIERQHGGLRAVPKRTPTLRRLGSMMKTLGRALLPAVSKARRQALTLAGFGFLSAAAWQLHTIAGLAAVGVSLLIVEALSGGDTQ